MCIVSSNNGKAKIKGDNIIYVNFEDCNFIDYTEVKVCNNHI